MEIVELKTTTLKLDYCHSMPHESNFPAHFFSMLIMSKKYLMAVKHDTFGERQKIPHSTFSLWNNITRIGSFESSKQIRDSTLLRLPSFLYETFLHSLACLEHIKLSCRTPFTKICLFRGRFPTGILISQKRYLVWVYLRYIQSLRSTRTTCVIHVNQIELKDFGLVSSHSNDQNTISNHTQPRKIIAQELYYSRAIEYISKIAIIRQSMR